MRSRDDSEGECGCEILIVFGVVLRMILALALVGSMSAPVDDMTVA